MTATEPTEQQTEVPGGGHLPPADPAAWQITGPISYQSTRTAGRLGVSVPVFCLPPAGQLDAATADARRALDVSATVAGDARVTEATAKRDRLAAALERDRAAVKEARREADEHATAGRAALVNGDDPDQFEKLRDAATLRGDKLGSRCGELAELLNAASVALETAHESAERDARLAVKGEYQARLGTVSARLSSALAADLAELWLTQSVTNALAGVC